MSRIRLFVKGRKDGVMRPVQHIPQDGETKTSPHRRTGPDGKDVLSETHFWMWLGDPLTAVAQLIHKDRVIRVEDAAAGIPA